MTLEMYIFQIWWQNDIHFPAWLTKPEPHAFKNGTKKLWIILKWEKKSQMRSKVRQPRQVILVKWEKKVLVRFLTLF